MVVVLVVKSETLACTVHPPYLITSPPLSYCGQDLHNAVISQQRLIPSATASACSTELVELHFHRHVCRHLKAPASLGPGGWACFWLLRVHTSALLFSPFLVLWRERDGYIQNPPLVWLSNIGHVPFVSWLDQSC